MMARGGLRLLAGVLVSLLVLAGGLPATSAAEGESEKATSYTVSPKFFRRLERVHGMIGAERYDDAHFDLERLAAQRNINPHELALVWQTYGYLYSGQEEFQKAAEAFEKCLSFRALPPSTDLTTRYSLAQVYLLLEQYEKAVAALEQWFAESENPNPEAYYLLAVASVQAGRYAEALPAAEQAVARSGRPRESWMQMLLSLYYETKDYAGAERVLSELVVRFPKRTYWLQLSAVNSEQGEDGRALAVLQLAYEKGFLTEDQDLRTLVQMLLFQEMPREAAAVLEQGMADQVVKADAAAWELLANTWLYAREPDRALEPLIKAAELSGSGDLYLRLAQLYLGREDWEAARRAVDAGLQRGKVTDRGAAEIMIGIVEYKSNRLELARQAFLRAAAYEKSRDAATRWLEILTREEKEASA